MYICRTNQSFTVVRDINAMVLMDIDIKKECNEIQDS
jgi:hypothetical protein